MILNFKIENQIIQRLDKNILVNKSKDYLQCNFKFDTSEWENIEKFAIFKDSWNEAYIMNLGLGTDCTCTPPEPVLKGNFFKVSVYGGDRVTTNELAVPLLHSGYTTHVKIPDAVEGVDIFTQIFEALDSKISDITFEDGVMTVLSEAGEISSFEFGTSFEDLVDVPETFPPTSHTHDSEDINDFVDKTEVEINRAYRMLAEKIRTYGE